MKQYKSASYQQDVMNELARRADVEFYGPGFRFYNQSDSLDDIFAKISFQPDLIVVGHAWLNDGDRNEVNPQNSVELEKTTLPKFAILNKEYVNLKSKLEYLKNSGVDVIFSHHHEVDDYRHQSGIQCEFWPFAFNHRAIGYRGEPKHIDLSFSGILQNKNKNAAQTDLRLKIMQNLFYCASDIPFLKKARFRDMTIVFNAIPRSLPSYYLSVLLRRRQYVDIKEYRLLLNSTKVFLNTLSPMGLISPRYFESMASKSLVFCEESSLYGNIFPRDCYLSFDPELRDFDEKLNHVLSESSARIPMLDKAYDCVYKEHTWENRIDKLLTIFNKNWAF